MVDSFERELAALTAKFDALATELPRKAVATSARAGANIVKRSVAGKAPVKTGALRGGLVLGKERSEEPGQAVIDVKMDYRKNSIFQKPVIRKDRLRGDDHAYYPASVEYGFFKRRPGGGLAFEAPVAEASQDDRAPGRYFMRRGAVAAEEAATKEIINTLGKEIDKLWR